MSCSPPSAKQVKLSSPINGLADTVLEEIFKRLPPYERLIVLEVCRRWHSISRKSWLDISKIDLTPIPGKHIRAIVNQCPNLHSVFAAGKSFAANELTCLARVPSLKRVSFIGCDFKRKPDLANTEQIIFSDGLENASWAELILHDAVFSRRITPGVRGMHLSTGFLFSTANLPASLTHLQLSGLRLFGEFHGELSLCLNGLERLENLACFILHAATYLRSPSGHYDFAHEQITTTALMNSDVRKKLSCLKNLKELCLGPALWYWKPTELIDLVSSLPKLEVLFLTHVRRANGIAEDLAKLIASNSVLRVLVLSGLFRVDKQPIELPARKRFPHGFGSDPLPLLHVFVGREASENIRFTKSTSDAAIIHPINAPMPAFLEREDIAQIFKNVWIVEKINEMAKHGGKLWMYETHDTASSILHI